MAEPTEPALITPAMLEEEEQLEAAGLERERKMLEEVMPRDPGFSPGRSFTAWLGLSVNFRAAWSFIFFVRVNMEILACALSDRFLRCGFGAGAGVGGVVGTCLE